MGKSLSHREQVFLVHYVSSPHYHEEMRNRKIWDHQDMWQMAVIEFKEALLDFNLTIKRHGNKCTNQGAD